LAGIPVAVFALGTVQDPHNEEEWQDSRSQLDNELIKFPWFKPRAVQMFGGRFDPLTQVFSITAQCQTTCCILLFETYNNRLLKRISNLDNGCRKDRICQTVANITALKRIKRSLQGLSDTQKEYIKYKNNYLAL